MKSCNRNFFPDFRKYMYLKQSHLVVSQLPRIKITGQELLTLDNIVKTRRFGLIKFVYFSFSPSQFTVRVGEWDLTDEDDYSVELDVQSVEARFMAGQSEFSLPLSPNCSNCIIHTER
jgi:hypothetical protein